MQLRPSWLWQQGQCRRDQCAVVTAVVTVAKVLPWSKPACRLMCACVWWCIEVVGSLSHTHDHHAILPWTMQPSRLTVNAVYEW
jgi:hypothetical protein